MANAQGETHPNPQGADDPEVSGYRVIPRETVEKIAGLARIGLTADEAGRLAGELGSLSALSDQLAEADVDDVEPTEHAAPLTGALREDIVIPPTPLAAILANAPDHDETCFIVPKVLE